MSTSVKNNYYSNSYDYAEAPEESAPPAGDDYPTGDAAQEGDLYTEVFDPSGYEEEAYLGGQPDPEASEASLEEVGEMVGTEAEPNEAAALRKQMDELKSQIEKSKLPESYRQDLLGQLERGRASLELSPDSLEAASEIVMEVQGRLTELNSHSPAAIEMASKLNKDVVEVELAAKEVGLDLDHLPQPPDARVMQLLNSLGIPGDQKVEQFKILKEQRSQNMKALKGSLEAQSQIPDDDGKLPLDQNDLNQTEAYRTLQDPEYQQMMGAVGAMRSDVLNGLKALGYQASEGERPDQIAVNGGILDCFDENTASLTLGSEDTTLTQNPNDFFTAPEEVDTDPPAWVDGTARFIGGVAGGLTGGILGGMTMIPGASIIGAAGGAYIGQELAHQFVQGAHDLIDDWF